MLNNNMTLMQVVFGPVPSRRLGRSLGINNIPPKICSYACVYCQAGRTSQLRKNRRQFYDSRKIFKSVQKKLNQIYKKSQQADYLAFVPDGEPTLDINLKQTIDLLKTLQLPVAVISNASLIDIPEVQQALLKTDWLSLKVDTVNETTWHRLNRPHGKLDLSAIKAGMTRFAEKYEGTLTTETMLVRDINDQSDAARNNARFLSEINPDIAYISTPVRPPVESTVEAAAPEAINEFFQIYAEYLHKVELLTGYEGNKFESAGEAGEDLLGILAVHPMRRDAVEHFLESAAADWTVVKNLLDKHEIIETRYQGYIYYIRS